MRLPAARAISHDWVTLASITSRKRSGDMSWIFATSFLPDASTRMSTPPKRSTAAWTIASQFASLVGRSLTLSALAPSASHSAAPPPPPAPPHPPPAPPRQHLGGERPEGAGGTGDDRDLAANVEQGE